MHPCAATPTPEELAAKQQRTLHSVWQVPKPRTHQQLAELAPHGGTARRQQAGGSTTGRKPRAQQQRGKAHVARQVCF